MSGRIEFKYLVPNALQDRLRTEILPFLTPDLPPGAGTSAEYTVRSVYYDTPRFDCYEQKSDGLKMRSKFRIRGYGKGGARSPVFLEIKRRNEAFITKRRAPLVHADLEAFLASRDIDQFIAPSSDSARAKNDAIRFLYHYGRHRLRPTVLVVYDREAFAGKFDRSLRVTFDKNLRGAAFPTLDGLFEDEGLIDTLPGHFIFEVKFFRRALPAWVRAIVSRYELSRMALSKYAMCLDRAAERQAAWPARRRLHAVLRG